jgi:hypothetical protein
VFGVTDPSSGSEVRGVIQDNRRSQTDLIDFLRSKKFAADLRPEIELEILHIDGKEIDVLTIFDHPQKPYYLAEDYRNKNKIVRANYIYSYFYINESSFVGVASFKYLTTELFTLPYIYCDEMQIELACPRNGHVFVNRKEIWFMYDELESKLGAFLYFLTNGTLDFNSRASEAAFIIFKNEQ